MLDQIDALLDETVGSTPSDVPVGAFLSGRLDSTLVASYAARAGLRAPAFSMGIPFGLGGCPRRRRWRSTEPGTSRRRVSPASSDLRLVSVLDSRPIRSRSVCCLAA
jgi:hypothetical protein